MHMNNPTGPVCVFVFAFKIVAAVKGAWKRRIVGLKPVESNYHMLMLKYR